MSAFSPHFIIDISLVKRLITSQYPEWASLPISPVKWSGWDHRMFHLGDEMIVRLPSSDAYVEQIKKEQQWLPVFTPQLPLPIPTPLALGKPAEGYPWPWSVYRWIEGDTAAHSHITSRVEFAESLADFLTALYTIDSNGGPVPGAHNFFRGAHVRVYDTHVHAALNVLTGIVDIPAATALWECALSSTWTKPPVWIHGDISMGNLLVRDGQLSAVIDFGLIAVGDPACDLAIAWTDFDDNARAAFRERLALDDETWARGRGWALWKALIVAAQLPGTDSRERQKSLRTIDAVLTDHNYKS